MSYEYAWEVINKFNWRFLPKVFGDRFLHKFAMYDEYHLVKINNTWYDIQTTKATSLLPNSNTWYKRDLEKNDIVREIVKNFNENSVYTIDGGIITFKYDKWILKVKIVKKARGFDPATIHCH